MTDGFSFALMEFSPQDITQAFGFYIKKSNDIPAPADIIKIIEDIDKSRHNPASGLVTESVETLLRYRERGIPLMPKQIEALKLAGYPPENGSTYLPDAADRVLSSAAGQKAIALGVAADVWHRACFDGKEYFSDKDLQNYVRHGHEAVMALREIDDAKMRKQFEVLFDKMCQRERDLAVKFKVSQ